MNVQIKLSDGATMPTKANPNDAGFDLTAIGITYTDMYIEYNTGVSMSIPEGYVGLLFPRSSVSKYNLTLANSIGVIDSGYLDEIKLRFKLPYTPYNNFTVYNTGDRVGQIIIIPIPLIEFTSVADLLGNNRNGGFGSTGQ